MKAAHRKLNVFFFGEAEAAIADQVVYYGVYAAAAALLGALTIIG